MHTAQSDSEGYASPDRQGGRLEVLGGKINNFSLTLADFGDIVIFFNISTA
jgi:hypothetical protein